jgi:hypothetical protein
MSSAATDSANDPAAPPREKSLLGKLLAILGVLVSLLFLTNLTFGGIIPFEIPDALPIVGNLDEVFFSGLLLTCLSYLGISLIPNFRGEAARFRSETPRRIGASQAEGSQAGR